jgi:hypothetical protein
MRFLTLALALATLSGCTRGTTVHYVHHVHHVEHVGPAPRVHSEARPAARRKYVPAVPWPRHGASERRGVHSRRLAAARACTKRGLHEEGHGRKCDTRKSEPRRAMRPRRHGGEPPSERRARPPRAPERDGAHR